MPRGPRISYPNAVFHVLNRFIDRHPFFQRDEDYREFLNIYFDEARTFGIRTFAYDLLPNHFHYVLQTPSGEISRFLQRFLSRAAIRLNRRHNRVGHLFQGRAKTLLVETDAYLETVMAYVLTNRVRAGLAPDVFHSPWNSVEEMLRVGPSRVSREALWPYLFQREFRETNALEEIARCEAWLRSIDPHLQYERFRSGHRGSFLSTPEFRRRILERHERRGRRPRKGRKGRRRKIDRAPIPWDWDVIQEQVRHALQNDEIPTGAWKNKNTMLRHLAWYIAFVEGRWSLRKIQTATRESTSQASISSAINRIRRDEGKRKAAEKVRKAVTQKLKSIGMTP